jgi:hypothetical protein
MFGAQTLNGGDLTNNENSSEISVAPDRSSQQVRIFFRQDQDESFTCPVFRRHWPRGFGRRVLSLLCSGVIPDELVPIITLLFKLC